MYYNTVAILAQAPRLALLRPAPDLLGNAEEVAPPGAGPAGPPATGAHSPPHGDGALAPLTPSDEVAAATSLAEALASAPWRAPSYGALLDEAPWRAPKAPPRLVPPITDTPALAAWIAADIRRALRARPATEAEAEATEAEAEVRKAHADSGGPTNARLMQILEGPAEAAHQIRTRTADHVGKERDNIRNRGSTSRGRANHASAQGRGRAPCRASSARIATGTAGAGTQEPKGSYQGPAKGGQEEVGPPSDLPRARR
jgi:hypothetical protein